MFGLPENNVSQGPRLLLSQKSTRDGGRDRRLGGMPPDPNGAHSAEDDEFMTLVKQYVEEYNRSIALVRTYGTTTSPHENLQDGLSTPTSPTLSS